VAITDAACEALQQLPRLETLHLGRTSVTDATVGCLVGSENLKFLDLGKTKVTNACCEALSLMPKLTGIDLSCKHITSEGVKRLQSLTSLTSLNLAFSKVTDEGIQELRKIPCLKSLSLRWTSITDAALECIAGVPLSPDAKKEGSSDSGESVTPEQKASVPNSVALHRTGSGTTPTALRRSKSDATSSSSLGLSFGGASPNSSPRQGPAPARSSSTRIAVRERRALSRSGDYARELQIARCRPAASGLCGLALVRTSRNPSQTIEPITPTTPESETTLGGSNVQSQSPSCPAPSSSLAIDVPTRRPAGLPPTPPKSPPDAKMLTEAGNNSSLTEAAVAAHTKGNVLDLGGLKHKPAQPQCMVGVADTASHKTAEVRTMPPAKSNMSLYEQAILHSSQEHLAAADDAIIPTISTNSGYASSQASTGGDDIYSSDNRSFEDGSSGGECNFSRADDLPDDICDDLDRAASPLPCDPLPCDDVHYRGIDLDEGFGSTWLDTDMMYRDGFFGEDVEIQLAIGDEEPVFRSCDPMEDEEIQPAMGDNEPIFRSCDMHISDAEQDSPLSRLDSPDHQGGGLFGAAPPQESSMAVVSPAVASLGGFGFLFCAEPVESPGSPKSHWKSNSCNDIGGLMRRQVRPVGDVKPSGSASPNLEGGPLHNIETLDLSVTELFGWGLQFLGQLPHLKSLNLFSTKVSDEGMVHIAGHRSLVDLNLCGTNITDLGVHHLTGLESLEELKVSGNKGITDAGATLLLSSLDSLRTLEIKKTSVSSECSIEIHEVLYTRGMKGNPMM